MFATNSESYSERNDMNETTSAYSGGRFPPPTLATINSAANRSATGTLFNSQPRQHLASAHPYEASMDYHNDSKETFRVLFERITQNRDQRQINNRRAATVQRQTQKPTSGFQRQEYHNPSPNPTINKVTTIQRRTQSTTSVEQTKAYHTSNWTQTPYYQSFENHYQTPIFGASSSYLPQDEFYSSAKYHTGQNMDTSIYDIRRSDVQTLSNNPMPPNSQEVSPDNTLIQTTSIDTNSYRRPPFAFNPMAPRYASDPSEEFYAQRLINMVDDLVDEPNSNPRAPLFGASSESLYEHGVTDASEFNHGQGHHSLRCQTLVSPRMASQQAQIRTAYQRTASLWANDIPIVNPGFEYSILQPPIKTSPPLPAQRQSAVFSAPNQTQKQTQQDVNIFSAYLQRGESYQRSTANIYSYGRNSQQPAGIGRPASSRWSSAQPHDDDYDIDNDELYPGNHYGRIECEGATCEDIREKASMVRSEASLTRAEEIRAAFKAGVQGSIMQK